MLCTTKPSPQSRSSQQCLAAFVSPYLVTACGGSTWGSVICRVLTALCGPRGLCVNVLEILCGRHTHTYTDTHTCVNHITYWPSLVISYGFVCIFLCNVEQSSAEYVFVFLWSFVFLWRNVSSVSVRLFAATELWAVGIPVSACSCHHSFEAGLDSSECSGLGVKIPQPVKYEYISSLGPGSHTVTLITNSPDDQGLQFLFCSFSSQSQLFVHVVEAVSEWKYLLWLLNPGYSQAWEVEELGA